MLLLTLRAHAFLGNKKNDCSDDHYTTDCIENGSADTTGSRQDGAGFIDNMNTARNSFVIGKFINFFYCRREIEILTARSSGRRQVNFNSFRQLIVTGRSNGLFQIINSCVQTGNFRKAYFNGIYDIGVFCDLSRCCYLIAGCTGNMIELDRSSACFRRVKLKLCSVETRIIIVCCCGTIFTFNKRSGFASSNSKVYV